MTNVLAKVFAVGAALPALVAALPLLIITLAVMIIALLSLLPSKPLRMHACSVLRLLTQHAAVLKGASRP